MCKSGRPQIFGADAWKFEPFLSVKSWRSCRRKFDAARRIKLIENKLPSGSLASSFGYTYSPAGDITAIKERLGGHGSLEPGHKIYNFGYDELHRLILSDLDSKPFDYDLLGNPTGTGFTVNSRNQLLETPEYSYSYDQRGNLTLQLSKQSGKSLSLSWTIDNKLKQVTIKNNGTTTSGIVSFEYDAFGRRTKKTYQDLTNSANSYSKTFIYNQEDLTLELENGKITTFYIHAPGIDNPIAMMKDQNHNGTFESNEIYFFTKDHLGSIREIIGQDGKLKQRNKYTAYGETTREKNDNEVTKLLDQPYGYTSRELDQETGFYFYRARYYDPTAGRFLGEDPIGFKGKDFNLYRYVQDNPLKFVDPNGELPLIIVVGVIVIVIEGFDVDGRLYPRQDKMPGKPLPTFIPPNPGITPSGINPFEYLPKKIENEEFYNRCT